MALEPYRLADSTGLGSIRFVSSARSGLRRPSGHYQPMSSPFRHKKKWRKYYRKKAKDSALSAGTLAEKGGTFKSWLPSEEQLRSTGN